MQRLKDELNKISPLSNSDWEQIASIMVKKEFKKGEIIHYGGEVMQDLYYLSEGVAKSSFFSDEGKEYIWQLYFNAKDIEIKNSMMDDCVSFYEQSESLLTFEALEDVECYKISMQKLEDIFTQNQKWQHIAMVLKQNAYSSAFKRVVSLMAMSATKRYEMLLSKYPDIFKSVKSHHIASYLGITPQSLSRLRKKLP